MSSINGIGGSNPLYRVAPKDVQKPTTASSAAPARGQDKVELSNVQGYLSTLKNNDIRADKVADIKAAIANGSYETDDKLNATIDKLLDEVL